MRHDDIWRCDCSLELDMGEYLTGVVTELMENDGDREGCLYILSLTTNKNRELIIKCSFLCGDLF